MYVYIQQILKYIFLCKEYWVNIRLINLKICSDLKIDSVGVKKGFLVQRMLRWKKKLIFFLQDGSGRMKQRKCRMSPGDFSAKKAKGWG